MAGYRRRGPRGLTEEERREDEAYAAGELSRRGNMGADAIGGPRAPVTPPPVYDDTIVYTQEGALVKQAALEARRAADRERYARRKAKETPERAEARRAADRERYARRKAKETPEQAEARRAVNRERMAAKRAAETPEQREARLAKERARKRRKRETETPEQRARRLQKQREANARYAAKKKAQK